MNDEAKAGPLEINRLHLVHPSVLRDSIEALQTVATRFATDFIVDGHVRELYVFNIKTLTIRVEELVKEKHMTVQQGAEYCNNLRNGIVNEARAITSPQGRAFAEWKKLHGPTLSELQTRYASEDFNGKTFASLTKEEKDILLRKIIGKGGEDNAGITKSVRRMKIGGTVALLVTGALAAYFIAYADDKPREMVRQAYTIGGGVLGGFAAGLAVTAACGPAAPLCAVALVLAGSTMGSIVGTTSAEILSDEIEEFSKWTTN